MPRIFDNIDAQLLPALCSSLDRGERADFCVGYFNLRGWRQLDHCVEAWSGEENHRCRLLIGMHQTPSEELRGALSGLASDDSLLDNQAVVRHRKRLALEFREQLARGVPTDEDEAGLRRLARQIRAGKVQVKLFLRYPLHAKLYVVFRDDPDNPATGYIGSSNLTFAGLKSQGELNVDVVEHDACKKLAAWFEERWNDRWCVDISIELAEVVEESWAREAPILPYHIYVYIAYHLAREARAGIAEFGLPRDFEGKLFAFQEAAVKIAAHHLNKREGVLLADVVGFGKTLMAAALARMFDDDLGLKTLTLCPKNLVNMWQDYYDKYGLRGRVMSMSRVPGDLRQLRRFPLVIIDESHNLRNRDGVRYRAIQEYIHENECRVILLTATPYNKTYLDLSNQLRLFVPYDRDLGVRPERLLEDIGEAEFTARHQASPRTLAAFELSSYTDDWRELMRLFMVRRSRSFVKDNYAETDERDGRKYLLFPDGRRSYFPDRIPKTVKFRPDKHFSALASDETVDLLNALHLPRYGLGNYIAPSPSTAATKKEEEQLRGLSRAGRRLMGFCRVNLFKRLESSGAAFLESLERHVLRNCVYLHAIEEGKPLPIGTQEGTWFDARYNDEDADGQDSLGFFEDRGEVTAAEATTSVKLADLGQRAQEIYESYTTKAAKTYQWVSPHLFTSQLRHDLEADNAALLGILRKYGAWKAAQDTKLAAVEALIRKTHGREKVLVFTQFADTARYVANELKARGIDRLEGVTGDSENPTGLAYRFSPVSNEKKIDPAQELRVLIATDVLSEGQNLQDCAVVINYDLPWAIIRLVQRAGRVDRIGQQAPEIYCYTFWPDDGVEKVLQLRARVRRRLQENDEVVGGDEAFFEDDKNENAVRDLYSEKGGVLDDADDDEVDLASYAYQIWKNATDADPQLADTIPQMPPVVFSTKALEGAAPDKAGALVYMRTAEDNDALAWVNREGRTISESQLAILRAASCKPDTPALERLPEHHRLVRAGVDVLLTEEKTVGGSLGRPSGARYRTYMRLKGYAATYAGTLMEVPELARAITDIYQNPLTERARDVLNRQLRAGIDDRKLVDLVLSLRDDDRLCLTSEEKVAREPQIICSMGLRADEGRQP